MSISYHHQLKVLVEILEKQVDEDYGSHDEFHQLQSLIHSLGENSDIPDNLKQTLSAIEQYASQHDEEGQHETLSSSELMQWIQQVDQADSTSE